MAALCLFSSVFCVDQCVLLFGAALSHLYLLQMFFLSRFLSMISGQLCRLPIWPG